MMGRQDVPPQLFYEFNLDRHVPANHMLREIDLFLDGDSLREALRPYYSHLGRPSIDPELIIRMLVISYVMGIRSERRLCDEVHLNLAYRWFCRLGLEGKVPDHSTSSRYRHGKFRESNLLRQVFEATVERCLKEDMVSGEGFAVDASLISADANKVRSIAAEDRSPEAARETGNRAAREYLETRDDAAFGAASPVQPKFAAKSDPAAQWTRAEENRPYFAYATNYLIDTKSSVIMMSRRQERSARPKSGPRAPCSTGRRSGSGSGRIGWPPTRPKAMPRTWDGWSRSAASFPSSP